MTSEKQDKYSMETADKQTEGQHPDNCPPTLMWYDGAARQTCPHCDAMLNPLEYYAHDGGWRVLGFTRRQWLFKYCNQCRTDYNLKVLGVSVEIGEPQTEDGEGQ